MDTSSAFANATLGTRKDDPKARYTLIAQAVEEFQSQSFSTADITKADNRVDTILVLSHEKLSIDLNRLFPNQTVLRLPKSGGVVDLDEHYKQAIQAFQIRSYFYGEPSLPPTLSNLAMVGGRVVGLAGQLTPYSFQIGWETLTIVRVGEGMSCPACKESS
jgi:polyribonucleotide 5'-hydroxyl-kinase